MHCRTLIFLFFVLIHEFGLGQSTSVFAALVNSDTRLIANKTGEAFQFVELNGTGSTLRGTLRILRTSDSTKFNHVQIGRWIYKVDFPRATPLGIVKARDTTDYDSAGNILRRVYYTSKKDNYSLSIRITSKITMGKFIQFEEDFDERKIAKSYSHWIVDFDVPKDRYEKTSVKIAYTEYENGSVRLVRTYDEKGKLISEKKY